MKKNRKSRNILILVFLFASIAFILTLIIKPSTARYIYNGLKNYYFESKNFYFNCDKMSENIAEFQIDNWDGVNSFDVTFNMDSFKNNMVASSSNITYNIDYHCSSKANCVISKQNGLIPTSTHKDYFTVTIIPNTTLVEGDNITLEVTATSTAPYEKTISGVVRLNVGVPGITYEITDQENRPYLDFKITNTLDFYQVVTPFSTYSAGDVLEQNVYDNLSAVDKEKCTSALIRLNFDPNIILVDITSKFYENAYSYTTQTINGKQYVNSITFGMGPVSSLSIRFYKIYTSNDYTYPYVNNSSVIGFVAL